MAVLVGVGRMEERFSVNTLVLPLTAKTIRGCMYGSVNSKVDFELYLDLYRRGQLDLDRMVTKTYTNPDYEDYMAAKQDFSDVFEACLAQRAAAEQ